MSEAVGRDRLQSVIGYKFLKIASKILGFYPVRRLVRKNEIIVALEMLSISEIYFDLVFPPSLESCEGGIIDRDHSNTLLCLRLLDNLLTMDACRCFGDGDLLIFEIDIGPIERERFAFSQSGITQ